MTPRHALPVLAALAALALTGCDSAHRATEPPPDRSTINPGVTSFCDRGFRIYYQRSTGSIAAVKDAACDGTGQ